MLIFPSPFLEFCLSTPAFSSIILFHVFVHAFDTLKIPEHRFGTQHKKVIYLSVLQGLFSCSVMQFSHESEHLKLMTSLIINLPLAVFYRQSFSCEVIDKSQGDFNSSNSRYFPQFFQQQVFPESLVDFNCAIIFRNSHLDFLCAKTAN